MDSGIKTSTVLAVVLVAALAAAGGFWLAQSTRNAAPDDQDQTMLQIGPLLGLPKPKPVDEFILYDHRGEEFRRDALEGNWTLVFFGFASCPHICPNTLFQLTAVVETLEDRLPRDRIPRVLFVSVDPARDSARALEEYRERFADKILAVSGTDDQLRSLALDLGAHYVIPDHEPGEWYNVDHSINVHLLDPEVQWAGVFSAPHEVEAMAGSLETFIGSD